MSKETNETEDQRQPGVIEETGITEDKERRLSLEAQKLIREFMIKWVSLPAIFLAVISFALGFFIEKVAFQTASNQAFQSAQSEVMKLIEQVMDAKHKADMAAGAIQSSSKEISKTEDKAKKFADELSSLQTKLSSTIAFQASDPQIKKIADVLARDPRITNVLNELDNSIQIRLKKADDEIEKIKSAYNIDFREGQIKDFMKYKGVYVFPFPVKHSWIEFTERVHEPYQLSVTAHGNTAIVTAKATNPLYYPSPEERLRRSQYPFIYRVWATSF